MKTLIIGNFRTGSWYLHKSYEAKGYMGLGELLSILDNDAENKINKFKQRSNVVAKLHPSQLITDSPNTYYRLCELADEIIYIQRQDTRQQVISFAVAKEQFDKLDKQPWLRNRKVFNNNLSDETILIKLCDGTQIDLGTKNKLSSVSYGGGDAGGGNVTTTFDFITFNKLSVSGTGAVSI